MGSMKAVVIREAGGPEVLKIETMPVPDTEAWLGPDKGAGIRPEPVRALHAPGPFSKCAVSARSGH